MQYEEVMIIDWLLLVGKYMYILSVEKVSHFTVSEKRELLQKVMNQYFRKFSLSLVVLYIKLRTICFSYANVKVKNLHCYQGCELLIFLQNVMNPYVLRRIHKDVFGILIPDPL